jgi:SAM-dependent methyltransferase
MRLSHNTVCSLEHFVDPDLSAVLREVWEGSTAYGWTAEFPDRKSWEVAMAVRALREHGVLNRDADVLGVGAGTEATLFVLTRHVRRVFATDLYLNPGDWGHTAITGMLTEPQRFWTDTFEPRRLVVQDMNALDLQHPDESFNAVFSSSSIEHFGDVADVSRAMDEIHRVLRPGGIVSVSTEFRLGGPPPGRPGILMFDRQQLEEHVIGNRGWDLVGGELELQPSPATLDVRVRFAEAVSDITNKAAHWSVYPHLVLDDDNVCWTSVHITLRKRGS